MVMKTWEDASKTQYCVFLFYRCEEEIAGFLSQEGKVIITLSDTIWYLAALSSKGSEDSIYSLANLKNQHAGEKNLFSKLCF